MKGQLTNEFILVLFVLILALVGLSAYFIQKSAEETDIDQSLVLRSLCNRVATNINLAALTNGYAANFTLPPNIKGNNYSVNIHNNSLTMTVLNKTCISSIRAFQIKNNTSNAPFLLVPGFEYQISNANSVITIAH